MKYIEKYQNSGYEIIDTDRYCARENSRFYSRDLLQLESLLKDEFTITFPKWDNGDVMDHYIQIRTADKFDRAVVSILSSKDEYFNVKNYKDNTLYECDQWSGLLNLLKDLKIIKHPGPFKDIHNGNLY